MKRILLRAILAMAFTLPAVAQVSPVNVTGQLIASSTDCSTSGSCVSLGLNPNLGGTTVQLGNTFSLTAQFEATGDGANWAAITGSPATAGSGVTSATAAGLWQFNTAGMVGFRVRASAYTSGGASVSIQASAATPDDSTLTITGTSSTNVAQIAGTTVLTGGVNGSLGVGGLAATGANLAGNPNLIGGSDGTHVVNIKVDGNGGPRLSDAGVAQGDGNSNSPSVPIGADGAQLAIQVYPQGYNGATWDRVGTAGLGNNILSTGLAASSQYGQYNTPQSNSSAPLGNITTTRYANLQTDIAGRLITTPGVTQMAWQPAQLSGVTATTTTRNTFTGLGQFNSCYVLLRTTTTGTATGTLNLYVQDSADGGTTWDDLISSLAITFGSGVATQRFTLSGQAVGATITTAASTNITQGSAVSVESLAAGSARQGPWGDQIRIREKVSGPSGSPVGVTYKIDAVCKN